MYLYRYLFSGVCMLLLLFPGCTPENRTENGSEREVIHTDRAPDAVGPYSQAIRAGDMLFVAGQVGLVPETGELAGPGLEVQAQQALDNIEAILRAAGFDFDQVVEVQVFLADLNDYGAFNEIYAGRFGEHPPARLVVEAARLPLDARVEIKMTAVR